MKTVCFNEDNEHFYANHPPEEMTREGCRALVDAYARPETIRSLLFCVNLQRALYDSGVWERFRDLPPDTRYVRTTSSSTSGTGRVTPPSPCAGAYPPRSSMPKATP